MRQKHTNVCLTFLTRAESAGRDEFVGVYVDQVKTKLRPNLGFPLVRRGNDPAVKSMELPQLAQAQPTIDRIKSDLDDTNFHRIKALVGSRLNDLEQRISALAEISSVLVRGGDSVGDCKVSLVKPASPSKPEDNWRGFWVYVKGAKRLMRSPAPGNLSAIRSVMTDR
jgi:hypothetical protein